MITDFYANLYEDRRMAGKNIEDEVEDEDFDQEAILEKMEDDEEWDELIGATPKEED